MLFDLSLINGDAITWNQCCDSFLPLDAIHSAVIVVCLAGTLLYSVKTVQYIVELTAFRNSDSRNQVT